MKTEKSTSSGLFFDCQPFRAWRYNETQINVSNVIAPPYDVISPEKQKSLCERSPYNVVRLILNKKRTRTTNKTMPIPVPGIVCLIGDEKIFLSGKKSPALMFTVRHSRTPQAGRRKIAVHCWRGSGSSLLKTGSSFPTKRPFAARKWTG